MTEDVEAEVFSLPLVLERLAQFEAEARPSGDVGRLLFAHELAKSCGLLALLCESYDVALMNPPYGRMPEACKDYCKGNRRKHISAHYPRTGNDLYAAFVEKGIELVMESGFVGALTSQTFLFLRSFTEFRTQIINKLAPPELLLDCEFGVLDGAKVATAASVLRKNPHNVVSLEAPRLFIRLWQTEEQGKGEGFATTVASLRHGQVDLCTYSSSLADFTKLSWCPYAYWLSRSVREIYKKFPPLDRDLVDRPDVEKVADVKQGLDSGSDPRFVRFVWEVSTKQVAKNSAETLVGRHWAVFAKTGWLDAFQTDFMCVVDWDNDGKEIKNYRSKTGKLISAPRNQDYYFSDGLCWMRSPQTVGVLIRQHKRINARFLPRGIIPTGKVCGVYPRSEEIWDTLGFLNSELAFFLVRIYSGREIQVGTVASLPFVTNTDRSWLGQLARAAHNLLLAQRTCVENSPYYVAPAIIQALYSSTTLLKVTTEHPLAKEFCWPNQLPEAQECPLGVELFARVSTTEGQPRDSLRNLALIARQKVKTTEEVVADLQRQIDQTVYNMFEIGPEDQALIAREIELRQKRPPIDETSEDEMESDEVNEDESEPVAESSVTEPIALGSLEPSFFVCSEVARLLSAGAREAIEASADGVTLITQYGSAGTLAYQVKAQFAVWFGQEQTDTKWAEAAEILGKSVEDWLAQDYFDFHVKMYRRRPIFWQLTSAYCTPRGTLPGAFSCLLHYHKLRGNTLQNILKLYLSPVLDTAQAQADATRRMAEAREQTGGNRRELAEARDAHTRAKARLEELLEFQRRLQELDSGARPVSPAPDADAPWLKQKIAEVTGGPTYGGRGWLPVIDYGVRVNIEPLKIARVLPRAADRIR